MHNQFQIVLLLYLLFIPIYSMSAEPDQNEIYFNHLKYEYGNRARTYIGMDVAAKALRDSQRGSFFQAYYEMEVLNQDIHGHMKKELHVDYQVNWFVNKGLQAVGYCTGLMKAPLPLALSPLRGAVASLRRPNCSRNLSNRTSRNQCTAALQTKKGYPLGSPF